MHIGISIDKDVPPPLPRTVKKYPHEEMRVGESFFVEGVKMQVVLNANWRAQNRQAGMRFTARKEGNGIRVWRTA